ncbi:hypothetical protein QFC20_005098 [Naganishia adeliensis]|uniref:Uncharacterized protein n=1 Tax=Naganishia adeliensis TaxID=92952 RepID=A0ACC2VSX6_9TREE|nr:hypothetical protein QFC20_005098 [Naganishia adeliensis]
MVQQGQCLCGQVKITLKKDQDAQVACHCLDCKKLSGAPYTSNTIIDDADAELTGETKSYTSKADSGNDVEHIFCPTCGSTIANRSPAYAGKTCYKTGLFPDYKSVKFGAEIYVKDRFSSLPQIEGAGQEQAMPSS